MNFVASREMSPLLPSTGGHDGHAAHPCGTNATSAVPATALPGSFEQSKEADPERIHRRQYHPKYAIHLLNAADAAAAPRRGRIRPSIYDDAAKQALIVLWEASDRVCGKRLKPLLRILVPALERHGHLKLDEVIRSKVLAMSAATIDRLLRAARNATRTRKPRRADPVERDGTRDPTTIAIAPGRAAPELDRRPRARWTDSRPVEHALSGEKRFGSRFVSSLARGGRKLLKTLTNLGGKGGSLTVAAN